MKRQDATCKKACKNDDRHGPYADGIHLGVDVGPVTWPGEEGRDRMPGEDGVLLDGGDLLFCEILWRDEGHVVSVAQSIRCRG